MGAFIDYFGSGGGGKTEGLYVWRKCNVEYSLKSIITGSTYYITAQAQNVAIDIYYADSYTIDSNTGKFVLTNPTKITCSYGSSAYASITSGKYFMVFDSTSPIMFKATTSQQVYNNSYGVSTSDANTRDYNVYYIESSYTNTTYCVSSKEDAYPNKEIDTDGYYYEKILDITDLGCSKFETGTFTPSSDVSSILLNHSLGAVPKFVLVNRIDNVTSGNSIKAYVDVTNLKNGNYGYGFVYSNGSTEYYSASASTSSLNTITDFKLKVSNNFTAGKKYAYLLIA